MIRKAKGDIMDEILLISHNKAETNHIENLLKANFPQHLIRTAGAERTQIKNQFNENTRMTLINSHQPISTMKQIKLIREKGFHQPILILSAVAQRSVFKELQEQPDTRLLERPYNKEDLVAFARKILQREITYQRTYPRFNVRETVGIESFGVSGLVAAAMIKISKRGALLKLTGHSELRLGSVLQLQVKLKYPNRFHTIPVQVVSADTPSEILPGNHFGVTWLTRECVRSPEYA